MFAVLLVGMFDGILQEELAVNKLTCFFGLAEERSIGVWVS